MAANSAYGAGAVEIAELFADYLEGGAERLAFALSSQRVDDVSRNAIEKSLASFGYPAESCTYATMLPQNPNVEGGDIPLDPQALFTLIEGLDPLLVIATDADAATALAQAYRIEFPAVEAAPARVFGRPAAIFQNLPTLLQTESGKQKAWRALKSLNA